MYPCATYSSHVWRLIAFVRYWYPADAQNRLRRYVVDVLLQSSSHERHLLVFRCLAV
jgi:hypothetical protein